MDRTFSYFTAMLLSFLMVTSSLAQPAGDLDRWGMSGWGWGHTMFGGAMMIVFWGGIILLVILLARRIGSAGIGTNRRSSARTTPLDILKARFTKGEIDEVEYKKRKKMLSS